MTHLPCPICNQLDMLDVGWLDAYNCWLGVRCTRCHLIVRLPNCVTEGMSRVATLDDAIKLWNAIPRKRELTVDEIVSLHMAIDLLYAGKPRDALKSLLPLVGWTGNLDGFLVAQQIQRRATGSRCINPASYLKGKSKCRRSRRKRSQS